MALSVCFVTIMVSAIRICLPGGIVKGLYLYLLDENNLFICYILNYTKPKKDYRASFFSKLVCMCVFSCL